MKQLTTNWKPDDVPLPEYPRPQLRRDEYEILNGWWDLAVTCSEQEPQGYDKRILVPYSPESLLSGVGHILMPDEFLHYRRIFTLNEIRPESRLLLHLEACDESARIFVNHKKAGEHHGGYLSFEMDITDLIEAGENLIEVCVRDPSDTEGIARGKQKLHPGGMFYQSQSGIWKTVWMEWVPEIYIKKLRITPDLDHENLNLRVLLNTRKEEDVLVRISDGEDHFEEVSIKSGHTCSIPVPNPHVWSPEDPWLYPFEVLCKNDRVKSYFAMRKYSVERDQKGILRFFLNNRPYFLNGILDQGYWPDGMMTPPSDEAYVFDIRKMKDLGFNMLRKHVKIESMRWYYHCDRIGMLVWQDMVNGGKPYHPFLVRDLPNIILPAQMLIPDSLHALFGRKSPKSRRNYIEELKGTLMQLENCVSICTWVPFNEGWGQFDAKKITSFIQEKDKTRPVDHASGWFDQRAGDYQSIHNYFFPLFVFRGKRAVVLSEYGGFSMMVDGHTATKNIYGYGIRHSKKNLTNAYERRVRLDVIPNIKRGLSGAVYTQLSDIEEEMNGIFTWDRKELKMDEYRLKEINRDIFREFSRCVKDASAEDLS